MRNVIAYELLSLDGVAENPDEFFFHFDDFMQENLNSIIATQDTDLLGHRSHDEWSNFWPTSEIEPFATFINDVEKFVATSSGSIQSWSNASAIEGDVSEFVAHLKSLPGGDIGLHASISLFDSLFKVGLIDELHLVIAPVATGHGRKLLQAGDPTRLSLINVASSPNGYLLADYQVHN